jgi:hypothetical protein
VPVQYRKEKPKNTEYDPIELPAGRRRTASFSPAAPDTGAGPAMPIVDFILIPFYTWLLKERERTVFIRSFPVFENGKEEKRYDRS